MNDAHLHLLVNHLPIIVPIIALLVMISGLIFKSEIIKRVAYSIFIFGSLTAIVAFATGDGAEELVEEINGIDEKFIKIHEESAELFAILSYFLGGLSIFGLWANLKDKLYSKNIVYATIVFSFIVLFYASETGTTGGEIRHTEIRPEGILSNP